MQRAKRPAVVDGELALDRFGAGISTLANLLRPTYGPLGKPVLNAGPTPLSPPELLDSGGDIARRLVQLADPLEDTGAMFLRGLLCAIQDEQADGVTLAAILMQTVFAQGHKAIVSGANPSRLRYFLQAGLRRILEDLHSQSRAVKDVAELRRVVGAVCCDEDLMDPMVELYRLLGVHGRIEVRPGHDRHIATTIMDGPYWEGGSLDSTLALGMIGQRTSMDQCAVFVSDLVLSAEQVVAICEAARLTSARSMLIVAKELSRSALATIMVNRSQDFPIYAVRPPRAKPEQQQVDLADLALIVGAQPYFEAKGDGSSPMIQYRLGSARKAWVSRTHFGFVSPLGDSHLVRRRVFELRQGWEGLEDRDKRRVSSERIARLTGRNAVLHVGGNTQRAIDQRLARAAQATNVLRAASTTGVLPGGGLALLNCRRSLTGYCDEAFELEAKLARAILTSALEAPVRQLALNAGQEPSLAVEIASERPDCALDPTDIIINCVHRAIEGAAQALTINGVVLHRSPELAAS